MLLCQSAGEPGVFSRRVQVHGLHGRLEADQFVETIQPCQLEAIDGNTLIISTPDQQRKKQLLQHHLVLLEALARGQTPEYHIRILARGKSA